MCGWLCFKSATPGQALTQTNCAPAWTCSVALICIPRYRIAETRVITSVRWVSLVIVIEIANQSDNYNHGLKISGLWSLNEWHLEGPKSLYIKNKDHSVILPSPMPLYKVNLDFLSSHLKLLINKTAIIAWPPVFIGAVECRGMSTGLEAGIPGLQFWLCQKLAT